MHMGVIGNNNKATKEKVYRIQKFEQLTDRDHLRILDSILVKSSSSIMS